MDNQAELESVMNTLRVKIRQLEQEVRDLQIALEDATKRKWRNGW